MVRCTHNCNFQVAKAVLSGAKIGSLVLMDEMGSGTDPMQGAALAQSLLEVSFVLCCLVFFFPLLFFFSHFISCVRDNYICMMLGTLRALRLLVR